MKAKAYIVHCAMAEPSLEWRKPKDCLYVEPLYTKREWQGLTDEEINKLRYKKDWTAPWTDMTFARAIEAKLKEKNNG